MFMIKGSVFCFAEKQPNKATRNETTALLGIPCLSSLEDEIKIEIFFQFRILMEEG
jgi:hypothetical protein